MRWLVLAAVVVAIAGALLYGVRRERERDVELLTLTAVLPGASPLEAERQLTEPLEAAVASMAGLVQLRSESRESVAVVVLTLKRDGRDGFVIAHEVQERVAKVSATLPKDVSPPAVSRLGALERERHRRFVLRSDELPRSELSRWADDVLRRTLEVQTGVRSVRLCGTVEERVEVRPDLRAMAALNVSPLALVQALEVATAALPSGRVGQGLVVRTMGQLDSVEAIAELQLTERVRVRDVATITRSAAPARCRAFDHGRPVVFVDVTSEGPLEEQLRLPELPRGVVLSEFKPVGTLLFAVQDDELLAKVSQAGVATQEHEVAELLVDPSATEADQRELRQTSGIAYLSSAGDTVVRVQGPDLEQLDREAEGVRLKLINAFPEHSVGARVRPMKPELRLTPEERRPAVLALIRLALQGAVVGALQDGERRLEVVVQLPELEHTDDPVGALHELLLPDGRRLDSLVKVERAIGDTVILRVNRQRTVELHTSVPRREVAKFLEGVMLPSSVAVSVE